MFKPAQELLRHIIDNMLRRMNRNEVVNEMRNSYSSGLSLKGKKIEVWLKIPSRARDKNVIPGLKIDGLGVMWCGRKGRGCLDLAFPEGLPTCQSVES